MAWPCRQEAWLCPIEAARRAYAQVARAISAFEPVTMVAREQDCEQAQRLCGETVQVEPLAIDDSWMRDTGPTFLVNGRGGLAAADWQFNAWGEEYQGYDDDILVAQRMFAASSKRAFNSTTTATCLPLRAARTR